MRALILSCLTGLAACGPIDVVSDLAFVDGRAVAPSGDSLLAYTAQGQRGVVLYDQRTNTITVHAADALSSPHHVQQVGGRWYVSDIENGEPSIAVFDTNWRLQDRLALEGVASGAHQFAVLEDGRVVVAAADARLLSFRGDSVATFAATEPETRSSLLVAAHGGVLHAVPGKTLTLYNAQGNIRWQQEWPWHDAAYVTDLSVDAHGRIHVLAGEDGTNVFVAFTLSPVTGEVVRWSRPGPAATFTVSALGEITPDSTKRWLRTGEN